MTKPLLLGLLLALAGPAAAQHTELIGRAGLGLLRFDGRDAARVSTVNYGGDFEEGGYTNNPYGRRLGTGFGLAARGPRVGPRRGLVALEVGYDWLRSRTDIAYVDYFDQFGIARYAATGTTHLLTNHIGAFLGLGRRFGLKSKNINLDVLAGPEAAFVVVLYEKGSGTFNGAARWRTDRPRNGATADVRLRADLTAWHRRLGLTASYSHGLSNYRRNLDGLDQQLYSRVLRLGLAYRLRGKQ
ncbi:hypothetical protein [uncultured Hymenobacter sp.]|uniref:hypothetical protein n=1 Tax=uncultured Hymenobacter sp. TaxID=170016 RepID=UPI0035C94EF9